MLSGTVVADRLEEPGAVDTSSETATPKGKGKEQTESFDAKPRYIPYLSSHAPFPPTRPWVSTADTRRQLGERLRVLRDVDEVIWGLIGDLTRLNSAWELEDGFRKPENGDVEGT